MKSRVSLSRLLFFRKWKRPTFGFVKVNVDGSFDATIKNRSWDM
jgi:hypothetical protein